MQSILRCSENQNNSIRKTSHSSNSISKDLSVAFLYSKFNNIFINPYGLSQRYLDFDRILKISPISFHVNNSEFVAQRGLLDELSLKHSLKYVEKFMNSFDLKILSFD